MCALVQSILKDLCEKFKQKYNRLDWSTLYKITEGVTDLEKFCNDCDTQKASYEKEKPEITNILEQLKRFKSNAVALLSEINKKDKRGESYQNQIEAFDKNFDDFKDQVNKHLYPIVCEVNSITSTEKPEEILDGWGTNFLGKYFDIILHVGSAETIFAMLRAGGTNVKYVILYKDTLSMISEYFKVHYTSNNVSCPDDEIMKNISILLDQIKKIDEIYAKDKNVDRRRTNLMFYHPDIKTNIQTIYKQTLRRCVHE